VIGEAGTGYKLMEGYKLPPVMFNQDEASALLTAAKLVQSKTDAGISKHYTTALDKIKAVVRLSEKDHMEEIDDHIMVMGHPAIVYQPPAELYLQSLLKAIGTSSVIEIKYFSIEKNETTQRKVEPVGIYYLGSHWYLVAFCQLRNDYRNFKTDRILSQRSTDETFTTQRLSLAGYLERTSKEQQLHTVMISMKKEVAKYVVTEKFYHGFVSEKMMGDNVEMTFLSASLEGFARWYLMFGDNAEILQPMALKKQVAGIIERMQKKL